MSKWSAFLALCVVLAGCSSDTGTAGKTSTGLTQMPAQAVAPKNNPAAKYLEVVGFRTREKSPGTLNVTFGVVNHSEADLGNLDLQIELYTTTGSPKDPPVASFTAKVDGLGPQEMKEVTATVKTKLRVYELPDWQFIRPQFQVLEPK